METIFFEIIIETRCEFNLILRYILKNISFPTKISDIPIELILINFTFLKVYTSLKLMKFEYWLSFALTRYILFYFEFSVDVALVHDMVVKIL